jgi:hypothetical protein
MRSKLLIFSLFIISISILFTAEPISAHGHHVFFFPPPPPIVLQDPNLPILQAQQAQAAAQAAAQGQAIQQGNAINAANANAQSEQLTQAQAAAQQHSQHQQQVLTEQQRTLAAQVALGNQQLAAQMQGQTEAQKQIATELAAQAEAQQTELSQQIATQQQNAAAQQFAQQAKEALLQAQALADAQAQAQRFTQAQASDAAYQNAANRVASLNAMAGNPNAQAAARARFGEGLSYQSQFAQPQFGGMGSSDAVSAAGQSFTANRRRFAGEAEIDNAIDADTSSEEQAEYDQVKQHNHPIVGGKGNRPTGTTPPSDKPNNNHANQAELDEAGVEELSEEEHQAAQAEIDSAIEAQLEESNDDSEAEVNSAWDADIQPAFVMAAAPMHPNNIEANAAGSANPSNPVYAHQEPINNGFFHTHRSLIIGLFAGFGSALLLSMIIYFGKTYYLARREKNELESARRAAQGSLPLPYGHALKVV